MRQDSMIQTERMVVRPIRPGDRDAFVRFEEASVHLHAPWQPIPPAGLDFGGLFDRALERMKHNRAARKPTDYRMIGVDESGAILGVFNLSQICWEPFCSAVAGWRVHAEWTGQGLATEGVNALLDFAFAPPPHGLGLHRVQAGIIPTNAPSIRVAHKTGFRREGYCPRYLKIAGQWQDHILFAKLADEHTFHYLEDEDSSEAASDANASPSK